MPAETSCTAARLGGLMPGIAHVHEVGPLARDVGVGRGVPALGRARGRLPAQPAVLDVGPEPAPGLEIDGELRLPGGGLCAGAR